jgi:hypothetical protein
MSSSFPGTDKSPIFQFFYLVVWSCLLLDLIRGFSGLVVTAMAARKFSDSA